MKSRLLFAIYSTGLLASLAMPVPAVAGPTPTYTVLHTFTGPDGAGPLGSLISDDEGNLYGTTAGGGDTTDAPCISGPFGLGCGVIYKIDRHGKESVLYAFQGGSDGAYPATELLLDRAGNLYGTARGGGNQNSACAFTNGCGVIFKLDRHGNESVLYAFNGIANGYGVASGLVRDEAGNLYGATVAGGVANPACTGDGPPGTCGIIYKLDPGGNQTVLHAFTGGADGYSPYGSLLLVTGRATSTARPRMEGILRVHSAGPLCRIWQVLLAAGPFSRSTAAGISPLCTHSKERMADLSRTVGLRLARRAIFRP